MSMYLTLNIIVGNVKYYFLNYKNDYFAGGLVRKERMKQCKDLFYSSN